MSSLSGLKLPLVNYCYMPGWHEEVPASYWQNPHIRAVAGDPIRFMDRVSIRAYMEAHRELLKGRVLDFGAGDQPYRDLVEGEYTSYDAGEIKVIIDEPTTIICNQVFQYINYPQRRLELWRDDLAPGGHLILTFATNWDEVPNDCYGPFCDRWRFTAKGMECLLQRADFEILDMTRRCEVRVGSFCFPIGYGCVARRPK